MAEVIQIGEAKRQFNVSAPVKIGKREWQPFRADGSVKSAHELLAPAGLAWEPEFRSLFAPVGTDGKDFGKVEGWRAVCRNDTGYLLGIVGDRYHLIKNESLADLADAIKNVSGSLSFGNAGFYRGGARPFLQLSSGERKIGGYGVESMISLFTAHDGSLNLTAGFSSTVIVCANTYAMALKDAKTGVQIRHTKSSELRIKEIEIILKSFATYGTVFDNAALKLMGKSLTEGGIVALIEKLVPGEATRAKNTRAAILEAYFTAPGALPKTRWGAIQAFTYHVSHERATRTTDRSADESRSESAWLGTGKQMVEAAWNILHDEDQMAALQAA
jgi:phage/plasmid-like protein (TIGR03299 family)